MKSKAQVEAWFDSNYSAIELRLGDKVKNTKVKRVIDYWAALITGCYINQEVFGFHCDLPLLFAEMEKSMKSLEEYDLGDNLYNDFSFVLCLQPKPLSARVTRVYCPGQQRSSLWNQERQNCVLYHKYVEGENAGLCGVYAVLVEGSYTSKERS